MVDRIPETDSGSGSAKEATNLSDNVSTTILASYEKSTKVINLKSSENLEEKLRQLFKLPTSQYNMIIQTYDLRWNCYVDVDDYSTITNDSKIQVISQVIQSHKDSKTETSSSQSISSSYSIDNFEDFSTFRSDSSDCDTSSNSSQNTSWTEQRVDTKQFSTELKTKLLKGEQLNWSTQHEFMSVVQKLIFANTLYPKPEEINSLCRNLQRQFPKTLKEHIGGGYDALKQRIINKLKNSRRPMTSPTVQVKKRKLKPDSVKSVKSPVFFEKKGVKNWSPLSKDAISVSDAIEKLKGECGKSFGKDSEKISKLTEITFSNRREMINAGANVPEVIEQFPSLKCPEEQVKEFERLVEKLHTKSDFIKNVEEYSAATLNIASVKAKSDLLKLQIIKSTEFNEQPNKELHMSISAMSVLPELLGCKRIMVLVEYPDTSTPDEIFDGPAAPAPYIASIGDIHSSRNFYIIVESTIVAHVSNFIEAFYYLFINFYIFNIEYTPKTASFYQYMQYCLLQIDCKSRPPSKVINFFQKVKSTCDSAEL